MRYNVVTTTYLFFEVQFNFDLFSLIAFLNLKTPCPKLTKLNLKLTEGF